MPKKSRQIYFPESSTFDYHGSSKCSLILFDVDDDECTELIAGNMKGYLSIYKFKDKKPAYFAENLGTITALAAEKIDLGITILVVITAEGLCHIFCVTEESKNEIVPCQVLKVPCNVTSILFKSNEIVLGSTDRNIYIYEFVCSKIENKLSMKMVLKKKFFCDKQVYSLSYHEEEGESMILAGFAIGGFALVSKDNLQIFKSQSEIQFGISSLPEYVNGNLNFVQDKSFMISANTEGMIAVHSVLNHDNRNIWSIDLEQEIVGVSKEKFTKNGKNDEICVCTWDGMTFIIDSDKNIVKFNFKDRVCTFLTGYYSISKEEKVLSIFYVPFGDTITMFYNVTFNSIPYYSLIELVDKKASKELKEKLDEKFKGNNEEKAKYFYKLLYKTSQIDELKIE